MDKLLQEAIADAKAVRETALANAKLALEEAFTPHLKSMLSKKLQAEMEGEDEEADDPVEEEMQSSGIGAADNKDPDASASEADSQGPEEEGSASEAGAEDENSEKSADQAVGENMEPGHEDEDADEAPDQAMGEQEEPGMEDEEGEEDPDLEEVLRQLEQEMGLEDEDGEEEFPEPEIAAPAEQEEPMPGMEDEDGEEIPGMEEEEDEDDIDLEEIIRALSEESHEDDEEVEEQEEPEEDPAAELEEYKQTVRYLRDKLQEVNLLNAKLLYTNKLFRSRNISENQKMKVIEQFDRAANVREVKLVYTTFAESMKRKPVNEGATRKGQASKPIRSTKSRKPIIGEQVDFKTRMKKLANII